MQNLTRISFFHDNFSKNRLWLVVLLGVLLASSVFCGWGLAVRAEREMRQDLLHKTQIVAQALDINRIRALTGTRADLASPQYFRLKKQFCAIRASNSQCRFIYLMGSRQETPAATNASQTGSSIFFFLDSEPQGSEDESPAGQEYEEVPDGYRRVFETHVAAVEGPVTDRWGVWVSGLVPLVDPSSGELIAVLGMDIDARNWKRKIVLKFVLPVGSALLALLVILLVGFFLLARRARFSKQAPGWMKYLEAALTVATGLVLSLFVAWLAQTEADRDQAIHSGIWPRAGLWPWLKYSVIYRIRNWKVWLVFMNAATRSRTRSFNII